MKESTMEEWRPIPGFAYEVSDLGRVRRVGGRVLKPKRKRQGYLYVCLSRGAERVYRHVSRLVCEAFHGPPPSPDSHADHDDEDRQNNRADNLAWLSPEDNRAKRKFAFGKSRRDTKLFDEDVIHILTSGEAASALAKRYDVSAKHIWAIRSGSRRPKLQSENSANG